MSKVAAVFAATGGQGSSVVKSLLGAGYKVRAFTRDPSSKASKAIAQDNVELVKADLNDPESYKAALKGADAAFVNADFWAIYLSNDYNAEEAKAGEIKQSQNAIQAAVDAGVKHIVYSTLDGDIGCVHWDSKAEVTKWSKSKNFPVTHLHLTFYYSNLLRLGLVKDNGDGTFTLGLPAPDNVVIPGVPAEQTGEWVAAALANPDKWIGKDMFGVTDAPTVAQMAQTLSELSGKTVKTNSMPEQYFLSDDFKKVIGGELWNQWKLFYDGNPKRDIPASKALIQGAWDFRAWAQQNKELKQLLRY